MPRTLLSAQSSTRSRSARVSPRCVPMNRSTTASPPACATARRSSTARSICSGPTGKEHKDFISNGPCLLPQPRQNHTPGGQRSALLAVIRDSAGHAPVVVTVTGLYSASVAATTGAAIPGAARLSLLCVGAPADQVFDLLGERIGRQQPGEQFGLGGGRAEGDGDRDVVVGPVLDHDRIARPNPARRDHPQVGA